MHNRAKAAPSDDRRETEATGATSGRHAGRRVTQNARLGAGWPVPHRCCDLEGVENTEPDLPPASWTCRRGGRRREERSEKAAEVLGAGQ